MLLESIKEKYQRMSFNYGYWKSWDEKWKKKLKKNKTKNND
jgi:hypothetical protein